MDRRSIIINLEREAIVFWPWRVEVQPALSGEEWALLSEIARQQGGSLFGIWSRSGLASYTNAHVALQRLRARKLVRVKKNGNGRSLHISPLVYPVEVKHAE